ncbi:FAD/NAD(P)-binding oxidoreductase [Agromyces rhizosphaerae]|uniref:FAD/NAD(P)-binding oxidoreductase n=1 Tax=Agromyces rhizosphaerae TaxID=88374 RepID=A0A9W6CW73_9MICO|nr:FAD-dependent oxidoreductase [Agromyces rhizosphaerae]GLI27186.1 FAD/NAD(P)-binding oxidoreductase [Agromyces rhizosphaerae]
MSTHVAPTLPHHTPTRVVLIGYGPVGARFVEELLPSVASGAVALTVLGAETHDAYNRVLVGEYAVGRASRERLDVIDTAAARSAGVDVRLGEAVVAIDRSRQVVRTHHETRVPYDRLVFATGARANVPTLVGLERTTRHRLARAATAAELDRGERALPTGIVALRDLDDAETVRAAVAGRKRIVVLGAGVLGMEAALAATEQGAEVVVVHHGDVPMERNLDHGAGRLLARAARAGGTLTLPHSRAEEVLFRHGHHGERIFEALQCADGKQVPGDLLVLSCGVAPRVELAASCDLAIERGVLVDEELRSWTDPAVFAIGDCAQVAARGSAGPDGRVGGGPAGLIGPGWRQADALAARLAAEATGGDPAGMPLAEERPAVVMLKAEGVDVVSGGDVSADPFDDEFEPTAGTASQPIGTAASPTTPPDGSAQSADTDGSTDRVHSPGCAIHAPAPREVTVWADPAHGAYAKMVTRGGVLEGFVAVGMPRTGAELTLLFERGSELPADRSVLLRLDSDDAGVVATTDPFAPDATVCWCNGVTVERITEAAAAGDRTVECVGRSTRAGTGCGSCKGRITELIARTPEAAPAVPVP